LVKRFFLYNNHYLYYNIHMRKKRIKNNYWDEEVMSKHIVHYNNLTDPVERDDYFSKYIYRPLDKLAEYLVNSWRWDYIDLNKTDMKCDLLSFLVIQLHHYKETAGRSFAFLSVIGKRYLITLNNKAYHQSLIHDSLAGIDSNDVPLCNRIELKMQEDYRPLPPFCDDEFLDQMVKYFEKSQLESSLFFHPRYNPIMKEVLKVVKNRDDHAIEGGAHGFNELIRQNPEVSALDTHYKYSPKTNKNSAKVVKKIKQVGRAAYKHYLNHGNLDNFMVNRTIVFKTLIQSQRQKNWRLSKTR
jgi:hypothetical protein